MYGGGEYERRTLWYKSIGLVAPASRPFCSMLLADMGADVIKVEDPKQGDSIRWWPPLIGKNSGFHVVLNRNKRSLTLNLKHPDGKTLFQRLVREADVVKVFDLES